MKSYALFALVLGLLMIPVAAQAGSRIFDTRDTCTTVNCLSTPVFGTYGALGVNSDPFVLQIFSSGECLRLDAAAEDLNLEMVLISPNGAVWRNDKQDLHRSPSAHKGQYSARDYRMVYSADISLPWR